MLREMLLTPPSTLSYRLAGGVVVVPFEDGIVVEGAAQRQFFRGRSARSFFPGLLDLLQDPITVSQAAATLGHPDQHIEQALRLLEQRSLLEVVDTSTFPGGEVSVDTFLATSRWAAEASNVGCAEDALARVAEFSIGLWDASWLAASLHAALRQFGFCDIRGETSHHADLSIVELGECRSALDRVSQSESGWLLPVQVTSSRVVVGSVLGRPFGCPRCYAANADTPEITDYQTIDPTVIRMAASITAWEAFRLASGLSDVTICNSLVEFDLGSQLYARSPSIPTAPCSDCNPSHLEGKALAVWQFESWCGPDPVRPKDKLAQIASSDALPSGMPRSRAYWWQPRIAPAAGHSGEWLRGLFDLAAGDVGALDEALPWPSGRHGGLVDMFLLPISLPGFPDLAPLYLDRHSREAVCLTADGVPRSEVVCANGDTAALLVIVAALERSPGGPINPDHLRRAFLDAGFAISAVRAASGRTGLRVTECSSWTPAGVAPWFDLDINEDLVAAVLSLNPVTEEGAR